MAILRKIPDASFCKWHCLQSTLVRLLPCFNLHLPIFEGVPVSNSSESIFCGFWFPRTTFVFFCCVVALWQFEKDDFLYYLFIYFFFWKKKDLQSLFVDSGWCLFSRNCVLELTLPPHFMHSKKIYNGIVVLIQTMHMCIAGKLEDK